MHICFVSMTVYPVLHGGTTIEEIGGAEVQQVQIAQLLRRLGHQVSFVTLDHGQPDGEELRGCRVYKAYRPEAGIPGLRFLYPRWTSIWRALLRADADVYYTRAAGFMAGMLALLQRRRPIRYIYAGAHDSDFMPGQVQVKFARDRWLFRFGLRRADAVIVQTEVQRDLLRRHYGRDADVIPNFMDGAPVQLPDGARTQVLWVGRLRANKRPLLFVDLARSLPGLRFTMIGPRTPGDAALYDRVAAAASSVPNLEFMGFQPREAVEKQFDRCRVLVSTSEMEGFPNVFLQAMRRGIPIVSFVDPDGVLGTHRLGTVVTDETELRAAVRSLAEGPLWPTAPIQDYYARHYGPDSVAEKYNALLARLES